MNSIEKRIEKLESKAGESAPDPAEWIQIDWVEILCRRKGTGIVFPPGSTQWFGPDGDKKHYIRRDVEKLLPPLDPDCPELRL